MKLPGSGAKPGIPSREAGRELQWKTAFLEAQVNSSIDGILVVDREQQKLLHNQRFIDIFKIPPRMAEEKDNGNRLRWVADRTTNPEQYIKSVHHLYAHTEEVRRDEIELKDGTILDRYSSPVIGEDGTYYGRIWSFRDITASKRAEQQLRVQTTAFNAAANAIVITDSNGTIQSVNAAFTALTGYSAREAVGQNPRILKSGKQEDAHYRKLWQTISSGRVWSGELINRRKDGSLYVEEMTITPLRDAGGAIVRYIAIKQDITERKRADEAVRRSETKFRTLYDSTGDAVMLLDERGFFDCNPATLAMFGCATREEFCLKHPADVSPPMQPGGADSVTLSNWQIATALEKGRHHFEWVHKRADTGQCFPTEVLLSAMELDGKRVLQATVRDIAERKRAEEELSASRQIIEGIINAIPVRVFWKDKNLVYLGCNAVLARDAGFADPKDIIGKDDYQMGWRDQAEKYRGDDRQVIESGCAKLLIEEPQTTPDGKTITLLSSKIPLRGSNGEISGVLGTYMDITERKRLEAYLFQSQKMETVGKVVGGIAHEFNSILTAIIGQSELLLGDLPPDSPLCNNAGAIRQSAERAAALTQQLLAYSRKQFLQPEVLDLNRILARMDGILRHLMGGGVAARVVPAAGLKAVRADAGQIEQVIVNMALNARDAMPDGGRLLLETSNVTIQPDSPGHDPELKPGGYVMLAITDTGAGMSEEALKRAFEPFFTTKGIGKGTGLGLAACHGIIKQSGGHISISSQPGRGATFKIFLPQVEPEAAVPIGGSAPNNLPRGTETILLAEDDPALREMAATLLRCLGYTVRVSAEGGDPSRDARDIDLLFTDVVMPHMSGRDLAGRVRALYPHTRVLFTSPNAGNAIVDPAVLNQGVAHLQKPFTPSALARKLREVLDQPGAPRPDPARKPNGAAPITDGVNTEHPVAPSGA
jgi:PAS domain S-box-containing protein